MRLFHSIFTRAEEAYLSWLADISSVSYSGSSLKWSLKNSDKILIKALIWASIMKNKHTTHLPNCQFAWMEFRMALNKYSGWLNDEWITNFDSKHRCSWCYQSIDNDLRKHGKHSSRFWIIELNFFQPFFA